MTSENKTKPENERDDDGYYFGSIREVLFPDINSVNAQFSIKDTDYIIAYT